MTALTLFPAVDIQNGQAVQLTQGLAGSEKVFGDPLTAALRWQDAGAEWLHLVDLDAAFGRGSNAELIAAIIERLSLKVELSGGLRDDAALQRALATGCRRVNIGTAALENPEWCERAIVEHGDRIGIAIDVKGSRLAARGWVREGGDWAEAIDRLSAAGCATFVVTDVKSDGMLSGPNLDLLRQVATRTDAQVIASGGIARLDDLRALRELVPLGVTGAIIGTALYVGNFTLPDALAVACGQPG
ncbi:bifunctional 1-(5-phosphoribosyl)-5-((5-phosphoribosylamino)methylideneamino)imidazole-4-carboxamide isomerase/phosphoribosylanthranilate isomerase PriA [Micropruina sp.]|uniref:bifunctional 1-(5-phosphoribosyl)-5-((5- phosphoribosylamino)methylideneamino)imidazole-4- carboxamide isomerase/phosphoribosylanthranilate isomerase PriA n=1 Tax=Micropruina sp. TaxID=2737536 RepID=UPI0039E51755